MEKPYSELVTQAESAVVGVKDPELRRAAFEKVLEDLLSSPSSPPTVYGKSKKASPGKRAKRGGPRAYIEELISDGFFRKPKTISDVRVELGNRGHHIPLTSLSGPLQSLCKLRLLRRQKTAGKGTYAYSLW